MVGRSLPSTPSASARKQRSSTMPSTNCERHPSPLTRFPAVSERRRDAFTASDEAALYSAYACKMDFTPDLETKPNRDEPGVLTRLRKSTKNLLLASAARFPRFVSRQLRTEASSFTMMAAESRKPMTICLTPSEEDHSGIYAPSICFRTNRVEA